MAIMKFDEFRFTAEQYWTRNLLRWTKLFRYQIPSDLPDGEWENLNGWYCLHCLAPAHPIDAGDFLFGQCSECHRYALVNMKEAYNHQRGEFHDGFLPGVALDACYDTFERVTQWWIPRMQFLLDLTETISDTPTLIRFHNRPMSQTITVPAKIFSSQQPHYIRGRSNRRWWEARFPRWSDGPMRGTRGEQITDRLWMRVNNINDGMWLDNRRGQFLDVIRSLTSEDVLFDPEGAETLRDEVRVDAWMGHGIREWLDALGVSPRGEEVEIFEDLWNLASRRIQQRGVITSTGRVEFPIQKARAALSVQDLVHLCELYGVDATTLQTNLQ